jgi:two-component system OmpR family sensor kinase
MAQAGNHTGFWRSVRELPERTPLRVKLTTVVLGLVAIALVVISVSGIGFLRSYLTGQADDSLSSLTNAPRPPQNFVGQYLNGLQPPAGEQLAIDWLASNGKLYQVVRPVKNYSSQSLEPGPAVTAGASWLSNGHPATVPASSGGGHWRVMAYPWTFHSVNGQAVRGTIIVGVDFSSGYRTLTKLTDIDVIVSALLLLVLAVVAVTVIRASLRPLVEIEQTAGAIAAGNLSKRVPERDPRTEVGRLGRSLNVMLSQIESAFRSRSRSEKAARRSEEKMRQFVADASHELRTPLTAIRGFAEYYRQRGGLATPESETGSGQLAAADMDRIMFRVEQESARMGILVEDMLLLARLDQQRPLDARPVDLLTLAADAVHDVRVVAPGRSINLTVGAGIALLVTGDEVRLRQVIGNLMSNALTHTPDGTPIEVLIRPGDLREAAAATAMAQPDPDDELGSHGAGSDAPEPSDGAGWDGEHVPPPPAPHVPAATPAPHAPEGPAALPRSGPAAVLQVTDHGPGLTAEQAEHVFERFYRADPARRKGGTGLGLAIVAALIDAHGGAAWVQSRPGDGATFCIALPLAPEAVLGADDEIDEEPDADGTTDGKGNASDAAAWFRSDVKPTLR